MARWLLDGLTTAANELAALVVEIVRAVALGVFYLLCVAAFCFGVYVAGMLFWKIVLWALS